MDQFVHQMRFIGGIFQDDPSLVKKHRKFCRYNNCRKPGEPEYCNVHALLKDLVFCSTDECKNEAMFESGNKPYCSECYDQQLYDEVIIIDDEVGRHIDDNCQALKDDKPCGKKRIVGFPGSPALYCTVHGLAGMIQYPSRKCRHVENGTQCLNIATYNEYIKGMNFIGEFCETHKLPNMISMIRQACKCGACGNSVGIVDTDGIRKACKKTNKRNLHSV